MKQSLYTNYDELPMFLTTQMVTDLLGISRAKGYALMSTEGFPSLRIGSRIVVPKDKFREWVDKNTGGTI